MQTQIKLYPKKQPQSMTTGLFATHPEYATTVNSCGRSCAGEH